jgi:hypothetical protein
MSTTTVVNIHNAAPCDVKIDRTTIFGNPFRIGPKQTREQAIARYRANFLIRVEKDEDFREAVLSLCGKRLGCWCTPLPCHGDVIVEWLAEQFA